MLQNLSLRKKLLLPLVLSWVCLLGITLWNAWQCASCACMSASWTWNT